MALIENTLFDGKYSKVEKAIEFIREFEPKEGYYHTHSFGKDSETTFDLLVKAEVKFESHHNCTGLDAPELLKFGRENYPDVVWHYPETGFFQMMPERGFPQLGRRWCCDYMKEGGGSGRFVVTGVRWAESSKRAKRRQVELCFKDKSKTFINPIITWSDSDVWSYIKENNLPYCELYDQGWKRLGCLLCPMTTEKMRKKEAERYPKYKQAWIRAFNKLYIRKKEKGHVSQNRWENGEEMFNWWMTNSRKGIIPDQTVMFE